jgi:glucose-1-phosphate cytidylyltransferase
MQFVDTGLHSNIGQRLAKVRSHLEGEEMFLANYSDQLSDLDLDKHVERFTQSGSTAGFVAVRPSQSFHMVECNEAHSVTRIGSVEESDIWINGGFLVLRNEVFDHMQPGEELVVEPFNRLLEANKLFAYKYSGFWKAMDTFKDKISFERMWGKEELPWKVWTD